MMKNARFAAWLVTGYLVVYCLLLGLGSGAWRSFAVGMYLFSPVAVIWMAYTVVRHGGKPIRELDADAEFGYGDRSNDSLGTWG